MATDIIARGMITEYIAGTNINFTENRDGTVEISASGSISSEDSVARDAIGNHKSDTSNPHNVTPAQIGLGNVDNTSDLDKPISTAVQKAIDNKADKTVATTSADGLISAEDKSKLDAFEITTTGGKLHDKDIATTDLIPTSLPANGGNADTVDGLHANGFIKVNNHDAYDCNTLYDAGLYLCGGLSTNTPNNLTYGSLFVMPYRRSYGNSTPDFCTQIYIPNGDVSDTSMWYRTSLENTWNEWKRSCDGGNADTVDGLHASDFIKNTSDWKPMNFEITYGDHNYPNVIDNNIPIMPKTCNYTHIISRGRSDNSIISILSIPSDYDDDIFLYQSISGVWKNIADGGNADTLDGLHANEIATNPNLLINPDFKINQRGETDFSVTYHQGTPIPQSQKYTVDRWRIMDGKANISNGKFVLSGTIIQVLENSIGSDFTATVSVESGTATASYNDSTKTFSIVGNNAVLNWAKLEYGSIATPFIPPDPTTELLKCKRYFETKSISAKGLAPDNQWIEGHIFDVPKRAIPSISLTSLLGTPDTLSGITGADSEIEIVGYPNVAVDRIHASSCSKALGYITYNYRYTADAEIY